MLLVFLFSLLEFIAAKWKFCRNDWGLSKIPWYLHHTFVKKWQRKDCGESYIHCVIENFKLCLSNLEDFWTFVFYYFQDVTPYMNPCPYVVFPWTPVPLVFNLFRTMGLRHLPVVNNKGQVIKYIVFGHPLNMATRLLWTVCCRSQRKTLSIKFAHSIWTPS